MDKVMIAIEGLEIEDTECFTGTNQLISGFAIPTHQENRDNIPERVYTF